jgi:hypothetical protein
MSIHVKNVGRGPQTVEGIGVLEFEQTGHADDTPHTQALIDAGHLLEMPDESTTPARRRAREE